MHIVSRVVSRAQRPLIVAIVSLLLVVVGLTLQICLPTVALYAQSPSPVQPRLVQPITTGLSGHTVYGITAVGTNPSAAAQAVFAATDKGLYRSNGSAGSSSVWTAVSASALTNKAVYAVKQRGSVLLVGTDAGVLRSVDGGSSWTNVSTTSASVNTVRETVQVKALVPQVISTQATRTITVGTGTNATLRTTTVTITTTVTQLVTTTVTVTRVVEASSTSAGVLVGQKVFDIEVVGTGTSALWLAATERGVYKSTNDGVTWSLVDVDRSANNNEVRGITVAGTTLANSTIVVNLWKEGLWRSTNGGSSWQKLVIAGESAPCRAVYAHSTNASTTIWFVGSVSGNLWRSTNGGSSWQKVYTTASSTRAGAVGLLSQAGVDAITGQEVRNAVKNTASWVFATTPQGIAYSLNGGLTWQLTRTPQAQGTALCVWNKKLYVGREALSTAMMGKLYEGTVQNSTGGEGAYDVRCGDGDGEMVRNVCDGGGPDGSGGNTGGGSIIPKPHIAGISPSFVSANGTVQQITVTGTNFEGGLTAWYSSNDSVYHQITGNFLVGDANTTSFVVTLRSPLTSTPGQYYLALFGDGGLSNGYPFVVGSLPAITSLSQSTLLSGQLVTLTINGTNFGSTPKLQMNGQEPSGVVYTTRTATQVVARFTSPAVGTYSLTIRNDIGTGATATALTSAAQTVTVIDPVPVLVPASSSHAPAGGVVAGQSVTLTLVGSGFVSPTSVPSVPGAVAPTIAVYNQSGGQSGIRQTLVPAPVVTWNSASQLTAQFTAPSVAGVYTIAVANRVAASEDVAEYISIARYTLTVVPPAPAVPVSPSIASLTTNPAVALASASVAVTVAGTGFVAGVSQVSVAGPNGVVTLNPAAVVVVDSTRITLGCVPPVVGTYTLTVTNAGATTPTASRTFTVNSAAVIHPAPTVSVIAPATFQQSGAASTIVVQGTGFVTGVSEVSLTGPSGVVGISPSITNTQITFPFTPSVVGTYTFTITNPAVSGMGGGTVQGSFQVSAVPAPSISGFTPVSVEAGSGTFTLTITGNNLMSQQGQAGSVTVGGVATTPLSASATQLVVSVPASAVSSAGSKTVVVTVGALSAQATLTVTAAPPPASAPVISDISPVRADVNTAFTASVLGNNFQMGAVVRFTRTAATGGGAPVVAQVLSNSATALAVSVPALLEGSYEVTVQNPDMQVSAARSFVVSTPPPPPLGAPTITSVSPSSYVAGSQVVDLILNLVGTNYAANATATFNGTSVVVTYQSPTGVQVRVPQTLVSAAGVYNLVLTVGPAGQTQSVTLPYTVTAGAALTLTGIEPAAIAMDNVQATNELRVFGTGLPGGATVTFDGRAVTIVNQNLLASPQWFTINVPSAWLATVRNYAVVVTGVGGASATRNFAVVAAGTLNPRPVVNGPGERNYPTTTAPQTVNIIGTGFGSYSKVYIGTIGNPQQTLVPSTPGAATNATELLVTLPSPVLATPGTYRLTVVNDAPVGGASAAFVPVVVTGTAIVFSPQPVISTVSPAEFNFATFAGGSGGASTVAVTMTGSGFVAGTTVSMGNGGGSPSDVQLMVQSRTETQMVVQVPVSELVQRLSQGFAWTNITVTNPTPIVGNASATASRMMTIVPYPKPVVAQVLPSAVEQPVLPSADVFVTLVGPSTGSGFLPQTTVLLAKVGGPVTLAIHSQTATQLVVRVPAMELQTPRVYNLTVQNPTPNAGQTVTAFTVIQPPPVLQSVNPTVIADASVDAVATLVGQYMYAGAIVEVDGVVVPSTVTVPGLTNAQTTVTIPASVLTTAAQTGTATIRMRAPAGAGASNALAVTVQAPVPVLTSITPTRLEVSTTAQVITLTGSGFVGTSVVQELGNVALGQAATNLATVVQSPQSATTLQATVPVSLLSSVRTNTDALRFVVHTPATGGGGTSTNGGGTSDTISVPVVYPRPLVQRLTPQVIEQPATTGTSTVAVTITGDRFVSGLTPSEVLVAGVVVNVQSSGQNARTATRLVVDVPANLIPQAGLYPVVVRTPSVMVAAMSTGGGTSDTLWLTVLNPVPTNLVLTPNAVLASDNDLMLTITGNNISAGAVITVAGRTLATTVTGASFNGTATATIPASLIAQAGVYTVSVRSAAPTVSSSATLALTVNNPTALLFSVEPAQVVAGGAGTGHTLTLRGAALRPGIAVTVGGVVVAASAVTRQSDSVLVVDLPSTFAPLRQAGTVAVTVRNPEPTVSSSATRTVTVVPNVVTQMTLRHTVPSVEQLTSGIEAGTGLQAFTVLFRDAHGNVSDSLPAAAFVAGVSGAPRLSYMLETTANVSSSGTVVLSRAVVGAAVGRFTTAGSPVLTRSGVYRVWVDGVTTTTNSVGLPLGVPITAPQNAERFVVSPAAAVAASLTGLTTGANANLVAGGTLAALTVSLVDAFGNPTTSVGGVGGTGGLGTNARLRYVSFVNNDPQARVSSTGTLTLATGAGLGAGQLRSSTARMMVPGLYTFTLDSTALALSGVSTLAVAPGVVTTAQITGVIPTVPAGTVQAAFTVRLFNELGAPVDSVLAVRYTKSGSPVLSGLIPLTRSASERGVYTAAVTPMTTQGAYTLRLVNAQNTSATITVAQATFTVTAGVAVQVAFSGLPQSPPAPALAVGEDLPAVSVLFTDQFGNRTDVLAASAAGAVTVSALAVTMPSGTGTDTTITTITTLPLTRLSVGSYRTEVTTLDAARFRTSGGRLVSNAQERFVLRPLDAVGTVYGPASALGSTGNTAFVVRPERAITASLVDSTGAANSTLPTTLTAGSTLPPFRLHYRTANNQPSDFDGALVIYRDAVVGGVPAGTYAIKVATIRLQSASNGNPIIGSSQATLTSLAQAVLNTTGSYTVRVVANVAGEPVPLIVAASPDYTFSVVASPATRVTFAGLNNQPTLTAGEVLNPVTVTLRDRFNQPTDHFSTSLSNGQGNSQSIPVAPTLELRTLTNPLGAAFDSLLAVVNLTATGNPGKFTTEAQTLTRAGRVRFVPVFAAPAGVLYGTSITGTTTSTVLAAAATEAEFVNVTTNGILAGSRLPAFTVRARDAYQNPAPWDGSVAYTNVDATGTVIGTSTGSISLQRTATIGTSTATASTTAAYPLPVMLMAGDYRLSLIGNVTPLDESVLVGNRTFTVRPATGGITRIELDNTSGTGGTPTTLTAGEYYPALTLRFFDRLQNSIVFRGRAALVPIAPTQTTAATLHLGLVGEEVSNPLGTYTTRAFEMTTAATYQLRLYDTAGVQVTQTLLVNAVNTQQTGAQATTTIAQPAVPAWAEFMDVQDTITAGVRPPVFCVRTVDAFGNPTPIDGAQITFSNMDGSSTGTMTLLPTATLGVSTATVSTTANGAVIPYPLTAFRVAGTYSLTLGSTTGAPLPALITGSNNNNGVPTIHVLPVVTVFSALVENLPTEIVAGEPLPAITITYRDRFGNPMRYTTTPTPTVPSVPPVPANPVIGTVRLVSSSTANQSSVIQATTLVLAGEEVGYPVGTVVSDGQSALSTAGTYTLQINGLAATVITGNKSLIVRPAPAVTAAFMGLLDTLAVGENQSAFFV